MSKKRKSWKRIADWFEKYGLNPQVFAISLARMGDGAGNGIMLVILPLFVDSLKAHWFHLSKPVEVGIVLSLYGISSSIAQPFAGALADRTGRNKLIILVGLVALSASVAVLAFIHSLEFLLALRVVQGVSLAAAIPTSVTLLTLNSQPKYRGRVMGFYTTMRVLGISSGPLFGGALHDYLGFSATFFIAAGLILLGAFLVFLLVHEKKEKEPERHPFQLFDKSLWSADIFALGFATLVMAGSFSMIITLEKTFETRLHETALTFGVAVSALMFARVLFQVPFGWLSDRIGRKPLIMAGLIAMAPATLLQGVAKNTWELALIRAFQGAGSAAVAAPAFALGADLSKSHGRGRQLSVLTVGFGLGVAIGPLLTGFLVLAFFLLPFIFFTAFLLIGAFVVYRYVGKA